MSNFIEEQNELRSEQNGDTDPPKKTSFKYVLCSDRVRNNIFLTIFALVVPILIYFYVIHKVPNKYDDFKTCLIKNGFRVPCGLANVTQKQCENIQCCFDPKEKQCYHFMPSKYNYDYDENSNTYQAAMSYTPYGNRNILKSMMITVNEVDENKLVISLTESNKSKMKTTFRRKVKTRNYTTLVSSSKLMLEISRSTGEKLLTTAYGPLIASQNYWEWSIFLNENYTFGFGRILLNSSEPLTRVFYNNKHTQGVGPVFWSFLEGKFHAVVIKNAGPLEITVLPSNLVILRSLLGRSIDLEVYLGPTPRDLHQQISGDIVMPPKWILDTHNCRKSGSTDLKQILQEFEENDFVSDCIHENLFLALQKQQDDVDLEDLKKKVADLKGLGKKFWLSVPPQIYANENNTLYNQADSLEILYKINSSNNYLGSYLNLEVVYPDFSNPAAEDFIKYLDEFVQEKLDLIDNIDGLLLVSNFPGDDSYKLKNTEDFQYISEDLIEAMSSTLPWDLSMTTNTTGKHIEYHNLYASQQSALISEYYKTKKPELVVESASNIFGETLPLTLENIDASWDNMKQTLDMVLFNSITGNHLVSVPICGDTSSYDPNVHETLCIRWYLVAMTMPTFRVYSEEPFREPSNLNTGFAEMIASKAIATRKLLEPLYFTMLSDNQPVIRPMLYNFYQEKETLALENQYMIGETLLVAHPLTAGCTKLQIYLPKSVGIWYEFYGGDLYNTINDTWVDINIVETDSLMFVAQGAVIPLLDETTLKLVIALDCDPEPCAANGHVIVKDNILSFLASDKDVTISGLPKDCSIVLKELKVFTYGSKILPLSKNIDICNLGTDPFTVDYYEKPN